jgi:tetratricopeptide (TPR) repeat protein
LTVASRHLVAVAFAIVVCAGSVAWAQPSPNSAAATLQFDKGRSLMKAKKYAEACAAFEQSQKLEPAPGTLYNLALCYVEIGKVASAWAAFRDLAARDPNAARRKAAGQKAAALGKRLPKLVLEISEPPPGLVVTLDGTDVSSLLNTETPIDLGSHAIVARAPAFQPFKTTAKAEEGRTVTIAIELVPERGSDPKVSDRRPTDRDVRTADRPRDLGPGLDPASPGEARDTPRQSRTPLVVAASGGALFLGGVAVGLLAQAKWDEARDLCGADLRCDNEAQLVEGNALVDAARLRAHLSTALYVGGAAAIVTGVYLHLRSRREPARQAVRVVPGAAPGHVGLWFEGRF